MSVHKPGTAYLRQNGEMKESLLKLHCFSHLILTKRVLIMQLTEEGDFFLSFSLFQKSLLLRISPILLHIQWPAVTFVKNVSHKLRYKLWIKDN